MIFDIPKFKHFSIYKQNRGPFIIIFYEPENSENKHIYFQIRKLSEKYKEIPILRFNFDDIKNKYLLEIECSNDILIIEKGRKNRIEKFINVENILNIFKYVKDKRLEYIKTTDKQYKNNLRKMLKPFKPRKLNDKDTKNLIKDVENDESEYIFPNSTGLCNNEKYSENIKKNNLKKKLKKLEQRFDSKIEQKLLKNEYDISVTQYNKDYIYKNGVVNNIKIKKNAFNIFEKSPISKKNASKKITLLEQNSGRNKCSSLFKKIDFCSNNKELNSTQHVTTNSQKYKIKHIKDLKLNIYQRLF